MLLFLQPDSHWETCSKSYAWWQDSYWLFFKTYFTPESTYLIMKLTRGQAQNRISKVFQPEMIHVALVLNMDGVRYLCTRLSYWGVFCPGIHFLVSHQVLANKNRKQTNRKQTPNTKKHKQKLNQQPIKKNERFTYIFNKSIAVSCLKGYENITILLWLQNFTQFGAANGKKIM